MAHYVGLDVSLKQTSICVVSDTGSIVREGVVDSDPEVIAAFVRSKAPHAVRVGLESGPTATWLWSELKRLGMPVICIDARHAKAVLKMQINKSDRNDAVGIARIMQTRWFKEVRVKDLDCHAVKALLTSRALLVKVKRDLENQIRGLLKNLGRVIGRAKFNGFAARAAELIELFHHGMIVVGLPYSFQGQSTMDEISGCSPYGASTITRPDGSRMPSENELAGARFQGRHVAQIAGKLKA